MRPNITCLIWALLFVCLEAFPEVQQVQKFSGIHDIFTCTLLLAFTMLQSEAASTNAPLGRPSIITYEYANLVVDLPYGNLVTALDRVEEYFNKLEASNLALDYFQKRTNQTGKIIIDQRIIISLKDRLSEVFSQLGRIGVIEPRSRQKRGLVEATSTNIFQNAIGSVGEFFGIGSLTRLEKTQHFLNNVSQRLYKDQEELSSRLAMLATQVADAVSHLDQDLGNIIEDHENNEKRRLEVTHSITTVVDQAEAAVPLFMEIVDRADHGLPSVLTLSEETLKTFVSNVTHEHRDLRPIYSNIRSYFKLPYAETSIDVKDHRFTTTLKIPFARDSERYHKTEKHITYVRLTSENNHIYLSHQEDENCHKTSTDVVCLTRPCRVNKYEDALKSCLVTKSKTSADDIVEVVYDPIHLEKNPIDEKIIVRCGGTRKEISVSKDVIQFSLPQTCSAQNQYFVIDDVITSRIPTKYLQDNELGLNFKEVSLNDTEEEFTSGLTIQSPATIQIVEHLRQEAKYAIQLRQTQIRHAKEIENANQNLDDYASSTTVLVIIIGAVVVLFVLILFFCLYCQLLKRCMSC